MKQIKKLATPKEKPRSGSNQTKQKKVRTVYLQPTVVILATYILLLLTKIIDVTLINRENEYYSIVILQMMIFLLPGAVWCMFSGEKYVRRLRLTLPKLGSVPLMLAAAVLMISGGVLISVLFGGLDSLSGNFTLYDTFVSKDNGTVPVKLYLILAYAVLPAICEEFVFRGIVCLEYENGGVLRSIVFSSLFFGMLHFDIVNLPVYMFSGAILALTLYATRSLFGAITVHFLYNLFGLFGQPYMNTLYNLTGSTNFFVFFVALLFLISAVIFCAEASRLYKHYLYRGYSAKYRQPVLTEPTAIRDSYLEVIKAPSAVACLAVYIIALIISWL
ncbi:MAG: CPBP family intramembrane metalloprotease [Clostridia bacterium]|nr:CPBP family intramembrane metalloprotease [Clostridia bacterium]